MKSSSTTYPLLLFMALLMVAGLSACGDDDNGVVDTTIRGNVVAVFPNGDQERTMLVCVRGTTFCDNTDSDGSFSLHAPVAGNVTLRFTGAFFTADLNLAGVPANGVVTVNNIVCETDSGVCTPGLVIIGTPGGASTATALSTALATASVTGSPRTPTRSATSGTQTVTPVTTASRTATGIGASSPTRTASANQTPTGTAISGQTVTATVTGGASTPTPTGGSGTPTATGGGEMTASPTPSPAAGTETGTETPTPTETPTEG